jgi:uncharacterized membrane protein YgcG
MSRRRNEYRPAVYTGLLAGRKRRNKPTRVTPFQRYTNSRTPLAVWVLCYYRAARPHPRPPTLLCWAVDCGSRRRHRGRFDLAAGTRLVVVVVVGRTRRSGRAAGGGGGSGGGGGGSS